MPAKSLVGALICAAIFGLTRAELIINFAGVEACQSSAVSDTLVLGPAAGCTSTPFNVGSTRIIHSGGSDCAISFFRDSNCNDFVRQVDSVTFNNGCLSWFNVVDGSLVPNSINGFSYSCSSLNARAATSTSTTMSTKAKRQTFPVLTNGSIITGGAANGNQVAYSISDVEATNDAAGTGVIASLITEAAQSVADAINTDSQINPTLEAEGGFGGVVAVGGQVNVSWNIEATSSRLSFNAVSLDAVIVMINEGLELALEANMDGFAANANGNNGNSFQLDVNFAKE